MLRTTVVKIFYVNNNKLFVFLENYEDTVILHRIFKCPWGHYDDELVFGDEKEARDAFDRFDKEDAEKVCDCRGT